MSSDDGDDIPPDECDSCGSVIDGEHAATSDLCWDCRRASEARIATLEADLERARAGVDKLRADARAIVHAARRHRKDRKFWRQFDKALAAWLTANPEPVPPPGVEP